MDSLSRARQELPHQPAQEDGVGLNISSCQAAGFLPLVRMGRIPHAYRLGVLVGVALPGVCLGLTNLGRFAPFATGIHALAAVAALVGLYCYKYAYVRAAQLPPLS